MVMYKVISIRSYDGTLLPIEKMEFLSVGKNWAWGKFKGYGFSKMYSEADRYIVTTERVAI